MLKSFLVALVMSSVASAAHFKVYVLTGQSNSLGCTAYTKDKEASLPPKSAADKEIPFFWSNRSTRGGDGPAALIGDSGGKIVTMQEQQGERRNLTFWGPEVGFGRALHKAGEKKFLIIKASRGGGGNSFWLKDGQMYNHVVKTVNDCAAAMKKKGDTFEIVGLLYVQGESNKPDEAAAAGQRFRDLLDQLREALPNAKNMQGYIGGVAAGRSRGVTLKQHEEIAKKHKDIDYFANTDLSKHLYDRLHFDEKAKLEIGERFAKAVQRREKELGLGKKVAKSYKPREWTNAAGKKITATFVKVSGDKVEMRLGNGRIVKVAIDTLAAEDQAWVKENGGQ